MPSVAKRYYSLTKPGVLYGNALTAAAGFLFGSSYLGHFDLWLFLSLTIGTTLVIAAACVLNNVLDNDIDRKMARTQKRATVTGTVSLRRATLFSAVLAIAGLVILAVSTNWLVVGIGIFGFVDYVVLYGMLSKRLSVHGTLVGSISGALPILAGYVAVASQFDLAALILFGIMFLWQEPEFYSISIYRRHEYQQAGVPVMAVVKGNTYTRTLIVAYTVLFVIVSLLLSVFGYTGWVYAAVMGLLGIWWLRIAMRGLGLRADELEAWARRMFRFSMWMILALCLMVSVGPLLP